MIDSGLAQLSINAIRTLSIDAVQKANSGHPGLPLGAAPMAYTLWRHHLRHNPRNPTWADRDRFVLSAGHGSMLLYSLLHLAGYDVSLEDLKSFRQWGSKTPGHPESFVTPGVEATTGPLGQGTANAVGMAMAERLLAARYNRPGHTVVDHYTYALVSDGDVMEGVAMEAASLAGHLKLGKLIYLYDSNDVTLDGPASMILSADVEARYASQGWHVQTVAAGDTDLEAISVAIANAKGETERPSLITVRTTIGFGSPNKAGSCRSHGSPLGEDEVAGTKQALGCNPDKSFFVPDEATAHMGEIRELGQGWEQAWRTRFESYQAAHPELAAEFVLGQSDELPSGWDSELPTWPAGESIATRSAAGKALNAIAAQVPWLVGGDADLGGSTKTILAGEGDFDGDSGRNIRFGVREHAMGAICNGMQYHRGVRSFAATFFVFSDYMRPAVRLAALNHLPVVYVWTHDSIGLGEDGPTHQPVEHLMSLRAIPNLDVVRPADANEAAQAWRYAMQRTSGPTALVLSRQNLDVVDRQQCADATGLHKGAYVLMDAPEGAPEAILIATGAEVELAIGAATRLASTGIKTRIVSMPCWEQFARQDVAYRESVLPSVVRARVAVEAGVTLGWREWVGDRGKVIGVDRFGASAPYQTLFAEYGLTVDRVVTAVRDVVTSVAGE